METIVVAAQRFNRKPEIADSTVTVAERYFLRNKHRVLCE